MFDTKVLGRDEIEKLLKMEDVIGAVESVYIEKANDETAVWPMVFYEFEPGVADMDIKSGWIKGENIFGLKLVSWFGANAKKNLPPLIGTLMIMDGETGAPLGFLDATQITGIRTGAAGALGAKYLARPDSKRLLLVGTGHVAAFQIAAMLIIFPELEEIMVYDPMDFKNSEVFVDTLPGLLIDKFELDLPENLKLTAVSNIIEATGNSDIIITVTPSRIPIIKKAWVRPGTHFSCIGADMPGKEEIDPEIFKEARVFTDDTPQCCRVGEIEIPIAKGILKVENVAGEIGDIIIGKTVGRQNKGQITVFDATGTALLDLCTGKLALDKAKELEAFHRPKNEKGEI